MRKIVSSCSSPFDSLAHLKSERLDVAFLDRHQSILKVSQFSDQCPDHVRVPMRTIISDALALNAAGMMIAHNHPSGIAEPSRRDCAFTRSLIQLGDALNISVVDHLIYTSASRFSFRDAGLI
jgi:DNA repair protein RadC